MILTTRTPSPTSGAASVSSTTTRTSTLPEVLRNTDYAGHIYIYDSERDSFMMAFKALGYSMNTEDPNEINDAYEWLLQMNNTMSPVYVTDEVIDGMMNGYKDIAVVYSGDAAVVLDENEDMSFYMPSQEHLVRCHGHSPKCRESQARPRVHQLHAHL